ncbi:MAG TPA: SufE family protein [Bdellovibrionota bacterium]|jgi:cysteine desulfuration protein SufE|nr:SufE family protein [Bdellovibrionota bacterium]
MTRPTPQAIQADLIEEFEDYPTWKERFEWILERGADYADEHPFPPEAKRDENLVPGCVSRIWLTSELQDGRVHFEAESEALIVQGLAALALEVYSDQSPQDIVNTPADYLEKTGLIHNLTPSRSNGLASLVKVIKAHAQSYLK